MKNILVTGGLGFIGSNWILDNIETYNILNIDAQKTGSNIKNLESINNHQNYRYLNLDICCLTSLDNLNFKIDAIINFCAESHVDRSITNPLDFFNTNIIGTANLLNLVLKHDKNIKFIQISTDEVFGQLSKFDLPFSEYKAYRPRSPYSASKASADHIVNAFHHTYGLNVNITYCCNNYGPRQYPEKLIPVIIKNALENKPIPVYGEGKNIREWVYVSDHTNAVSLVLEKGKSGESYCVGSGIEIENIKLINNICEILDKKCPKKDSYKNQITFVTDRLGHDFRYSIDSSKIKQLLKWKPNVLFSEGLEKTIDWYINFFKEGEHA